MDLGQLEDNKVSTPGVFDAEKILENVEVIAGLTTDTETALSNLHGLLNLEEVYTVVLDNADRETITDNQVMALRAGLASGIQAANGNPKTVLGIDTESVILVASSSLAYDLEGVKNFLKEIWEKFKDALVKANAFFRKLFLKFISMVSFRKGTIEKLEEDMVATTTIKTELSGEIAKKLTFLNLVNGTTGTDIDLSKYTKVANAEIVQGSSEALDKAVKVLKERVKNIEAYVDGNSSLKTLGVTFFKNISSALTKLASNKVIKIQVSNKQFVSQVIGGFYADKVYMLGVDKKGNVTKTIVPLNEKGKTVKGITQTNMIALLKDAGKVNDDFKSTVDDIFSIVDTAMGIADELGDIILKNAIIKNEEIRKQFKVDTKSAKNMIAGTPWLAFNQGLSLYKEVGLVISLSKAVLKDKK